MHQWYLNKIGLGERVVQPETVCCTLNIFGTVLMLCLCLQVIAPEEIIDPSVDEQSVMTYLSQFPKAKLKPGAPLKPKLNPKKARAYGPGEPARSPDTLALVLLLHRNAEICLSGHTHADYYHTRVSGSCSLHEPCRQEQMERYSQTFSDAWRGVSQSLMRRDGIVKITAFLWCDLMSRTLLLAWHKSFFWLSTAHQIKCIYLTKWKK